MRKNSIKNTRINSEVQRELSSIISRELKDPRIHPMTTVVSVEVTPDLKYCKAYISVLGNEEAAKDTIQGLKSAVDLSAPSLQNALIYGIRRKLHLFSISRLSTVYT